MIKLLSILLLVSSLNAAQKCEDISLQFQWKNQFEYAGFYAAQEKGFYKDVGLDVSFKEFENGMNPVREVLSGKATYGITYSDLIIHYLDGEPVVFLANFFKHSPLVLATQADIQLPSDLKGKKIMGVEESIKSTAFLMMFKEFGMDMHSFTNVAPTFNVDDFIQKKVDAMVIFSTNELYYLEKSGVKFNILNPSNYGTEFYDVNLFTSRAELINHPKRVKNFTDASIKGWQYALSHKEEIIDLILKKYNTQHKSRAALEFEATQIQNMILPNIFPIGSIDAKRVKMMAESFKEMGLVAKDIPLEFGTFIYDDKEHPKELTQNEKEYLTRKGTLKLCVDPTWMPLEAIQKGKYTGISSEYFNLLQKRSPLNLQLYPTSSWQESLKAAQERKCDIFTLASSTPDRLKYMDFTESYITLPLVLATTLDKPFTYNFYDLKDKKIAVVKGYAIADILHNKYPDMPLVLVNNIQEGLKKVESGEAYGYVDNLMVLAYAIQHNFTNQIKISSRLNASVSLAIGTRNDEPMLHTIFEKLIYLISEKEKQEILNHWISVEESTAMDYSFLWKTFGVFGIIILFFLYRNYELSKYNRILQTISHTDPLTQLFNRIQLDKDLARNYELFLRYGTACGVIIIDIDHFKEINDTFGHQAGDEVLKQFAQLLHVSLRATDIAGRWGGEEFLIICPNTDMKDLLSVAKNLRNKIAQHDFTHMTASITASFGVNIFDTTKDLHTIIKEADDALYDAKDSGRNRVKQAKSLKKG